MRPGVEILKLLDAAIFQVLIGNADAHGKNYSLLHKDDAIILAPLYDLLSTVAYPDLSPNFAMKIAKRGTLPQIGRVDWDRFARDAGVSAPYICKRVKELAQLGSSLVTKVAEELEGPGLSSAASVANAARVRKRAEILVRSV